MLHKDINDAIIRSQHCQRNWDVSKSIPKEDLDLMITAITQCPSKQNIAHYKLHLVTNRDVIEKISKETDGFIVQYEPEYKTEINTQVLANLLVVFERNFHPNKKEIVNRNHQMREINDKLDTTKVSTNKDQALDIIDTDTKLAVGIAAGYLNLTASLLGYSTGCCTCFNNPGIKEILNLEDRVMLLMGVGFKDPNRNRRIHHYKDDFVFPVSTKQQIPVNFVE